MSMVLVADFGGGLAEQRECAARWVVEENVVAPPMEDLTFAVAGGSRTVVGAPIGPGGPEPGVSIRQFGGGRLPDPPISNAFSGPLIIADASERLHLFWATDPPPGSEGLAWTKLWHALGEQGSWSAPELLVDAFRVPWRRADMPAAIEEGGRLHFAIEIRSDTDPPILRDMMWSGWTWRSRAIARSAALYVAVAVPGKDTLVVAYVASDPEHPHDHNSVFVSRSENGGDTWSAPRRVQLSGDHPAVSLHMHAYAGVVHLAWLQDLSDGHQALRYLRSTDAGDTWSAPVDLALPDALVAFDTGIDARGRLHVLYTHRTVRGLPLAHRSWSGSWSGEDAPLQSDLVTGFAVGSAAGKDLVVAASAMQRSGEATAGPRLVILEGRCVGH